MITQIATITLVTALTYVFFRLFGPRDRLLFLTRQEKIQWDQALSGRLGTWVTATNISGTITSFATLLFLMGSVKLFGLFSLSTALTIFIGAFITNYYTQGILSDTEISGRFAQSDQTAGVIAFLLWDGTDNGRRLAALTKWVSLIAIAAIVWLEFLVFTEFTSAALALEGLFPKVLVMSGVTFVVIYFVLKYGIRGFTFADFLHAPLIALAVIVLLIAVVTIVRGPGGGSPWTEPGFFSPVLTLGHGVLFACHVLVLNCLQVLCTEPHWLRAWLFGEQETATQVPAMAWTAVIWLGMLLMGFSAFFASGLIGDEAILRLVEILSSKSLIFLSVFWIAVTAAVFSTADTQAYCLLLVSKFDPRTGSLENIAASSMRPALLAVVGALGSSGLYAIVRHMALPIEKMIFVIIPSVVTLAPVILLKATGRRPAFAWLVVSIVGYLAVAVIGFLRPDREYYWTLSAVFVPVAVFVVATLFQRQQADRG